MHLAFEFLHLKWVSSVTRICDTTVFRSFSISNSFPLRRKYLFINEGGSKVTFFFFSFLIIIYCVLYNSMMSFEWIIIFSLPDRKSCDNRPEEFFFDYFQLNLTAGLPTKARNLKTYKSANDPISINHHSILLIEQVQPITLRFFNRIVSRP